MYNWVLGLQSYNGLMKFRFGILSFQMSIALLALISVHEWGLFALWAGTILMFGTIPKKLICARCDGNGKKCHSLYLGLYTSKLFSKENKNVPVAGGLIEGLCLIVIALLPFIPLLKNPTFFLVMYLALLIATLILQFFHACKHCVLNANEEWKKNLCPANKIGRKIWRGKL
jgi:hypothetical protein